ncbi:MAG: hypothetical protein OEV43_06895 [Coriobacteriia bacterium]|nr:hypothetical protein [Coriobacteriia bacterium]
MRRLVAAMIAALMLLSLVGCGGGDGGGEGTAEQPPAAAPVAAPAAGGDEVLDLDETPPEGQVYMPLPTSEDVLTEEISQRLETDQPMIVYFFDSSQKTTNDQDAEIDPVMKDYRGLIDLVKYDVGKYVSTDASGAITVKETALMEGAEDETALKVARLISKDYLAVSFTPYIVLVDSHGYIVFRFRGPIDRDFLEQQVLRATQ